MSIADCRLPIADSILSERPRAPLAAAGEPRHSAGTDAGAPLSAPQSADEPLIGTGHPPALNDCGAPQSEIANRQSPMPELPEGGMDPASLTPRTEAGALDGGPPCPSPEGEPPRSGMTNDECRMTNRELSGYQIQIANDRLRLARAYDELKAWHDSNGSTLSLCSAAAQLREPLASLWKVLKRWLPHRDFNALIPPPARGRKAQYELVNGELEAVRSLYVRLDESEVRGRGLGSSKFAACRLAALSDDPAIRPHITDAFRELILGRKSRSLPPAIAAALDTPSSVLARARDKRSTLTTYVSTPRGRTWVDESGREHPTRPGDCLSADDGTLNFYATIPWPFGGDKCSDKFGVKLGRWQFLPCIDDRSEFCLAFDIVARQSSAYSAADVAALLGRSMIDVLVPEWWLLERGSWESDHVKRCLEIANTRVRRAWESKQKSAVERFFDRAWTPLSLMPGHVGRDQGRFKQIQDLALACQEGRRDPRDFFLDLTEATRRVAKAVEYCNTDLLVSRSGWGKWVPQERFTNALAEQPRPKLPAALSLFFAREQRVKTVRGGGVGFSVECPEVRFPVFFQCAELWEFEGCEVKCYFDPYADPVLGTLTLHDREWRGYKRGHIIAREVPALDLPPQAVFCDGWTSESAERSLAVRKAISKAVRTETWNYLGCRTSQARDGFGNSASLENGKTGKREDENPEPLDSSSRLPVFSSSPRPRSFPAATPLNADRRAALRAQAALANQLIPTE